MKSGYLFHLALETTETEVLATKARPEKIGSLTWLSEKSAGSESNASNLSHPKILEELAVHYLKRVTRDSELVSQGEETLLAKRIAQGDTTAKQRMILANLRLVISIAKQFANREIQGVRVPFMELVQEGNIGLIKAVEKFDHSRGFRFSTYATWWIKQHIYQAYSEYDRAIRLPGHVMDGVNKYRRAYDQLMDTLGTQPNDEQLASKLNLPLKKVRLLGRIAKKTLSLDAELTQKDGQSQTLGDTIEAEQFINPEVQVTQNNQFSNLKIAMTQVLNEKEREVIDLRFGLSNPDQKKMTLDAIGQRFGVTRECIRQIEIRAFNKLRESKLLTQ